jgi:c-di-GMP-related signal transduction protein
MDIFLARQPIFDKNQNVFAYELLYRDGTVNAYSAGDADMASSNVLNSLVLVGLENLTGGKRAFVNFTAELIRQGVATLFPRDQIAIELLENIKPSQDVIESCKALKKKGYLIVLDDFVYQEDYRPLVDLADIIKMDFQATPGILRRDIVKRLSNGRIRFLAEKIETIEEFQEALNLGYTLFQGYFFSRPIILSAQDISPLKMNYLQLIQESSPEMFPYPISCSSLSIQPPSDSETVFPPSSMH